MKSGLKPQCHQATIFSSWPWSLLSSPKSEQRGALDLSRSKRSRGGALQGTWRKTWRQTVSWIALTRVSNRIRRATTATAFYLVSSDGIWSNITMFQEKEERVVCWQTFPLLKILFQPMIKHCLSSWPRCTFVIMSVSFYSRRLVWRRKWNEDVEEVLGVAGELSLGFCLKSKDGRDGQLSIMENHWISNLGKKVKDHFAIWLNALIYRVYNLCSEGEGNCQEDRHCDGLKMVKQNFLYNSNNVFWYLITTLLIVNYLKGTQKRFG